MTSLDVEEIVETADITSVSFDYVFYTNCNINVAIIPENAVEVDGVVHDHADTNIQRTLISKKVVLRKRKYTMVKCEYHMKLDSKLPLPVQKSYVRDQKKFVQFLNKEAFEGIVTQKSYGSILKESNPIIWNCLFGKKNTIVSRTE